VRVLVAHNYYQQPGGEDVVFSAETELLEQHGHTVYKYTEHSNRISGLTKFDVALKSLWSLQTSRTFEEIVEEFRPDVAHFHNTFPLISPSAYYACARQNIPVVQTLHNYRLLCPAATFFRDQMVCEDCLKKTPPFPGIVHGCYRQSRVQTAVVATMLTVHRWKRTWSEKVDVYIALTDFARNKFIQGGLPAEKIVVKPNFVSLNTTHTKSDRNYALFVGRLSPEKGITTLIRTWQRLNYIPLKIAGSGVLLNELKSYLTHENLNYIDFLGHCTREQIVALMRNALFLILPSEWYENFPVTIAEAFACGLPVITSKLGSMQEIVEDGKTGLHFEPGNITDLASKVAWAWNHRTEMETMGENARKEYEAKYTPQRNYGMLMEIYNKAIGMSKKQ
jgi:glycosyltransferase involved in cell wall biosynthesis